MAGARKASSGRDDNSGNGDKSGEAEPQFDDESVKYLVKSRLERAAQNVR